jgi:hypothetical protein
MHSKYTLIKQFVNKRNIKDNSGRKIGNNRSSGQVIYEVVLKDNHRASRTKGGGTRSVTEDFCPVKSQPVIARFQMDSHKLYVARQQFDMLTLLGNKLFDVRLER